MNSKNLIVFVFYISLIILIQSCGGNQGYQSENKEASDVTFADSIQTTNPETPVTSARMNLEQSQKQFIRTAELKFKVKNVRKATSSIEDLTAKYQGFVTYTSLISQVSRVEEIQISADSSLETKYYHTENEMVLRVPNVKMDSLLREMNSLVDFLDYRIIKADDVGLQLLAGNLENKRLAQYRSRQIKAIDQSKDEIQQISNAENTLLDKQSQEDNALIRKLSLEDQIQYSTIKLHLYQREQISREMIENYKNIESYQPGLAYRIKEALYEGWQMLEHLIVFLFRVWYLILLGLGALIVYLKLQK